MLINFDSIWSSLIKYDQILKITAIQCKPNLTNPWTNSTPGLFRGDIHHKPQNPIPALPSPVCSVLLSCCQGTANLLHWKTLPPFGKKVFPATPLTTRGGRQLYMCMGSVDYIPSAKTSQHINKIAMLVEEHEWWYVLKTFSLDKKSTNLTPCTCVTPEAFGQQLFCQGLWRAVEPPVHRCLSQAFKHISLGQFLCHVGTTGYVGIPQSHSSQNVLSTVMLFSRPPTGCLAEELACPSIPYFLTFHFSLLLLPTIAAQVDFKDQDGWTFHYTNVLCVTNRAGEHVSGQLVDLFELRVGGVHFWNAAFSWSVFLSRPVYPLELRQVHRY